MLKNAITNIMSTAWPTLVIFLVILILLRIFYLKQNKKKFVLHEELLLLVFVTYVLLLFELVTSRDIGTGSANFTPFKEIFRYDFASEGFYRQVIGNILLFIPFGYFATSYASLSKIRHSFLITFLTSVTIETVQFFIGRSFDIDDIILNVVGGVLGFLLYVGLEAIKKKLPKLFKKDIFYNIISLCLLALLVLYFLNIYGIWEW